MADGQRSGQEISIREDLINSWMRTHPGAPRPANMRSLAKEWISEEISEIRSLRQKRIALLEDSSENRANLINLVPEIPEEHQERVYSAVYSAHWSVNSQGSWTAAFADLTDRRPWLLIPVFGILIGVPIWVANDYFFGWGASFKGGESLITIGAILALSITYRRVVSISSKIHPRAGDVWRIIALTGFAYVGSYQYVKSITPGPISETWQRNISAHLSGLGSSQAAHCIQYSCRYMTAIISLYFIVTFFEWLTFRAGPKEAPGVVASARIILALLDLAVATQRSSDNPRLFMGSTARDWNRTPGLRPYIASPARKEAIAALDAIASISTGSWRRSLKTGDTSADARLREISTGISVAAERWKSVVSVGGARVPEMKEAFALALAHACLGQWELLAAEVSTRELFRRKLVRAVRRIAAVSVICGSILLVTVKPTWANYPSNSAVDALILGLAGMVCLGIDPSIGEKVASGTKVLSGFGSASKQ
ncbi:hypothetical protein [Kitasatospora sp. NPDC005751]|uniref:hypothetical protein n=1 Tax=Kitasatospora sp. NPDC005751 TaxID=3157064 RepID=UPI00340BAD22